MKATLYANLEDRTPICLEEGGKVVKKMTFAQAKKLWGELRESLWKIEQHFRCVGRMAAFLYSSGPETVRCDARGSVKQSDGTYLCKRHVKKATKEAK